MQLIRSLLYVPASSERFIAKAHDRGADAIILDLEERGRAHGKTFGPGAPARGGGECRAARCGCFRAH